MQFISFSFPNIPHVSCIFQTRQEGCSGGPYGQGNIAFNVGDKASAVLENRSMLLQRLNIAAWAEVNQVHGDKLVLDAQATPLNNPSLVSADGLATRQPGLGLLIKTADCQPVLLTSIYGRHVAALHVGWKGNRIGFIKKAVAEICQHYSLCPCELAAVRGPSLGPAESEFVNFDREWGQEFNPWWNPGDRTVDLWRLTRDQLYEAGLAPNNIYSLDICTYANPELFFSYRRDKPVTGRQASIIWIGG